jgi:hypothetical protein
MRCSVTGSIEAPYPSGYDDCDHSNLMKTWFKHDGLLEEFKRSYKGAEKEKPEWCGDEETPVANYEVSELQASIVISHLEKKIRRELWEFAEQLEESRKEVTAFIEGMEYVIRSFNFKEHGIQRV